MKYNPTLHKLSNGVTVILDPMDLETTNVAVSFKTGSLDEDPNQYGLTHFCEHMLCKGTKRFPTSKDINDYIEWNSGTRNAFTNGTELRFHGRILGDNLDKLLDVLADQLQNSSFSPERIELERLVILDELHRAQGNKNRQQTDFISKTLFNSSLYSFQTLGTEENIKSFTRDQMLNWLSQRLSAKNCTIAISGKISNPDAVLKRLETLFAFLPIHDVPHLHPKPTITPIVTHRLEPTPKGKQGGGNVNIFIAIPRRFPNIYQYRVEHRCENFFRQYLREEIYDVVRQKNGLVYGVSDGTIGDDTGVYYIETECAPENVSLIIKLIAQTCARVYNDNGVNDDWLKRKEAIYRLGDADWLDSAEKRQDTLISYYRKNDKLYDFFEVVNLARSITAADVQKHTRGFFDKPISIITDGPKFDGALGKIWTENFPNSTVAPNMNLSQTIINKNQKEK